ncbi:hypothetical protein F8M41_000654 [Gigaspora margarita]|uniref:Uncharacterized protein n=1 Tax=Gigaspora margarita TaxID=4874 RepID=A0A8H4AZJ5_GIGMA|nr:hypothetical protein F8M41_000654 [Gigaspora margarita]
MRVFINELWCFNKENMNRLFFNSFYIIFLINLLALAIDSKHARHKFHPHKFHPFPTRTSVGTCTITDISTETVTSSITCFLGTTPTSSAACPDNQQIPDDCDKCEQTEATTCTPTTTTCTSTNCLLPPGLCRPSGNPCDIANDIFCNVEACCNRGCSTVDTATTYPVFTCV